jgi:hypothetical protein
VVAATRFGVPPLDWGAIAFGVACLGMAIKNIKDGFGATESLDQRFADQQVRAKASLVSNVAVPGLARLLSIVANRLPGWALSQTTTDELSAMMQDELQSFDYVDDLRSLGDLANDHDDIDGLFLRAERWGTLRGWGGVGLVLSVVFLVPWVLFGGWDPPLGWVLAFTALGAVSLLAAGTAWAMTIYLRRRLTTLCRKYLQGTVGDG